MKMRERIERVARRSLARCREAAAPPIFLLGSARLSRRFAFLL